MCSGTWLNSKTVPHADSERLAAGAAVPQTGPSGFAFRARSFAESAAVRTDRTIRPQPRFDVLDSSVLIGEVRGVEVGLHGDQLLDRHTRSGAFYVKCNIAAVPGTSPSPSN